MDVILVALGANDVFGLSSPRKFRRYLTELLKILREKNPDAKIFVANVPMVRDFIALPNPLRYVLSRLAKLHHFNAIDLISKMENVVYFDDVKKVDDDFFSDGIHPSVKGYDLWAEAMVDFFLRKREAVFNSYKSQDENTRSFKLLLPCLYYFSRGYCLRGLRQNI